jgi:hypothetical protein
LFCCSQLATAATIDVYISGPDVQTTFLTSGATTVTFNSLSTGNRTTDYVSAIGTYDLSSSRRLSIQNADQYGGAGGTRYATFGAQSTSAGPIPLQLAAAQTYFGFWWSAGDQYNGVSFYNGSTYLGRFSGAQLLGALSPQAGTVTSLNGATYANSDYYGNPNNNLNSGEAYAYVHVVAVGMTFNRVVFDNSGSIATGFESDNHTVFNGLVNMPGSAVHITNLYASEPATMGCALVALSVLLGSRERLKRRRRRQSE